MQKSICEVNFVWIFAYNYEGTENLREFYKVIYSFRLVTMEAKIYE